MNDTLRALVVFARFPDEVTQDSCDEDDWPVPTLVPAWADSLVEGADPDTVGSMTHFFWLMSGGRHLLLGRVFDSVILTPKSIQQYATEFPLGQFERIQRANMDVTRQVITALGDDALDYDLNGDGYFDHMHIVYHHYQSSAGNYSITPGYNAVSKHVFADSTFNLPGGGSIQVGCETGSCQRPIEITFGGQSHARRSRRAVFDEFKHEYFHDIQ